MPHSEHIEGTGRAGLVLLRRSLIYSPREFFTVPTFTEASADLRCPERTRASFRSPWTRCITVALTSVPRQGLVGHDQPRANTSDN